MESKRRYSDSVHNYYQALTYMTAYFSKSESEVSESLKQAAMEIKKQNFNVRGAMKKSTYSFKSTRQLSVKKQHIISCRNCGLGNVV